VVALDKKKVFSNIKKKQEEGVNENKTKHTQVARAVHNDEHVCCGQHKFEHVRETSYLGSQMNQTNSFSSEIQARIFRGNQCCYAYGKLIKSNH
jgi:hypothetical protein